MSEHVSALPPHPNDPLRIVPLGSCVLVQWSGLYCETLFLDGTSVKALAQPENEQQARQALECGHTACEDWTPVGRLCFEHEAVHTMLARFRQQPVSPVLWDVAHGVDVYQSPERLALHYTEESEVLALQRYINTGDHNDDPRGRLRALSYEFDLEDFRRTALAILRPPDNAEAS